MYEELKNAENRVVGLKQLLRSLEEGAVLTVYLADDAEEHVKERVLHAIGEMEVHIVNVETMKELGEVCGIDVRAACAAIIEN
ncbi:ribosomal L7Ae/L30e/S12e/Gadd45 family protein [Christensenella timonensis]|uniref:ribosomal L7Ae/L30e/S12e/Gadd45 family protein n=1 Tax=Christensenella timonensis TaxID=1816678 RepID=UPI00082C582B|nr:ribosomal L7Ae/L30e/S12e/Gadd45 family protein [Christensenella timonensis]